MMNMKQLEDIKKPVECCLFIKHETNAAFLVTDTTKEPVWLPKSQVYLEQDAGVGDTVVFTIPEWLAIEKELI